MNPEFSNFMRKESLKVGAGQYAARKVPLDTHHFPKDGKSKYYAGQRSNPIIDQVESKEPIVTDEDVDCMSSRDMQLQIDRLEIIVERMERKRDRLFSMLKSVAAVFETHMEEVKGQIALSKLSR